MNANIEPIGTSDINENANARGINAIANTNIARAPTNIFAASCPNKAATIANSTSAPIAINTLAQLISPLNFCAASANTNNAADRSTN